jgi:T1SS-143 domain-containing protein
MTCTNVILAQPQSGATVDYTIPEGDSARLSFGPEDIQGIKIGENGGLVISFTDGGTLNIANFQSLVDGGNLLYLADGTLVDPKLLQSGLASGLTQATANDNDVVIGIPSENTIREITLEPSQNYVFAFDMTAPKKAETVDGKFVMSFDNGSEIILTNYEEAMAADIPPSISMESKICTFTNKELVTTLEELAMGPVPEVVEEEEIVQSQIRKAQPKADDVANIEPAAGDEATAQQLAQIEPAAGEPTNNSGYGFNSSPGSDPFDGKPAIGPIDPTALRYVAPSYEPNTFFDQTPTPNTPPPTGPIAGAPLSVLDETNLNGGPLVANGTVVVDFGADGPGAIVPNGSPVVACSAAGGILSSGGVPVVITPTANGYEGYAGAVLVFTFAMNTQTGDYTYTQVQPFDHADANDPNDDICLTFPILVTDDDDDSVETTVTIKVADDAPIALDDFNSVNEGGTVGGNVILENDTLSQDDPTIMTTVVFKGVTYNVPAVGDIVIMGDYGTLTINGTGAYSYTAKNNNPDGTDVFTYTLVDYDGDSDPADLTIRVSLIDDQPIIIPPPEKTVDETNLGPITVGGALVANFGGDGPGTYNGTGIFTSGGSQAGGNLFHNGTPVVVTFNAGTNTYTGAAGGTTVFTLVINETTGAYEFKLFEQLDHADGTDPNDEITLYFGAEAEDADGDTTATTITINVLDDAPSVASAQGTVDETDLGPVVLNGNLNVDFGEDGPATVDAVKADGTFNSSGSKLGGNLTSGGVPVVVSFDAGTNTYTGMAGAVTVFTMVVFDDGTYRFKLFDTLDHADPNDPNDIINLDFGVLVTDFDGDVDEGIVRIRVKDDVPTLGNSAGGVDETNLDGGPLTYSDVLDHNFGLELGTITPNGVPTSSVPLTSGGVPVVVTQTANGYEGKIGGTTIFTLTINPATGQYTYTQFDELDHPNRADPNDTITISFPVEITSTDLDSDSGVITITVYDDGPVAVNDITSAEEGQLITGNVVANDLLSEDNPNKVVNIHFNGADYAVPNGGSVNIVTALGTLVMNSNGTYTYTATNIGDPNGTDVFTYTLRDDDGDIDTADLSVRVTPDGSPVAVSRELAVDETNLTPGPMIFKGDLNVDYGLDGAGTVGGNGSFSSDGSRLGNALTSNAVPVIVTLVGDTYTGTAGGLTVFTLTIANDGKYTFQLFEHIDHADGTDPNDIINLHFGVTVTDDDGDTADGEVIIRVHDDAPVAYDDITSAEEGQLITGNVVANDELSEDHPNTVVNVLFNGVDYAVPPAGTVAINTPYGVLTMKYDGTYTYQANNNDPDGTDVFTYILRDYDGDEDTAELSVRVTPDGTPVAVNEILNVDETNLTPGPMIFNGNLNVDYGLDGGGTITLNGAFSSGGSKLGGNLTHNNVPVVVTLAGDTYTGSAGGTDVFTLKINADGSYVFTLLETLDHADATDPNDIINLTFGVTVTDADGDAVNGDVVILVHDDAPVAYDDGAFAVEENHSVNGNVTTNDEKSEDEPSLVTKITFNGSTVVVPGVGNAVIAGQYGVLTINAQGQYSYTANNNNPNGQDVFTYTLKDYDGDEDTAEITFTVRPEDDQPIVTNGSDLVDETNLRFGVITETGTVSVNYGNDGPGTVAGSNTFSSDGSRLNNALTHNGVPVVVTYNAGTHTYTGTAGATTIFTLLINANGTYSFKLYDNLDHADPNDPNDEINLHFGIQATDNDGDVGNGTLTVVVRDDVPTIGPNSISVDETNFGATISSSGNVGYDFGQDGTGTIQPNNSFNSSTSLLSHGLPVVVTQTANGYEGKVGGTTIFTLVLNANTGAYTYTQFDQIDHPNASNPDDIIALNFGVTITEGDGDTATGYVTVNVHDDAPDAVNDGAMATEGGLSINGNVTTNDDVGADEPGKVINVRFNGVDHAVPNAGTTSVTGAYGTLVIDATGAYTYTTNNADLEGTDNFIYTLRDYDGDTDTATLSIQVEVDANPVVVNATELVDETNLLSGTIVETGSVSVNYGGDGPGTVTGTGVFSSNGSQTGGTLSYNGTAVVVSYNAGTNTYTGTAGGTQVFTMQINANGSYTFRLLEQLDHANGNDANDTINLVFGVKATDSDGDVGTGSVTVTVRDDAPVAVDDGQFSLNENTTRTGNVMSNDQVGQDLPGTVTKVTFGGTTVNVPTVGTTSINGTYGTLTIAANGAYSYHANSVSANRTDVFVYTLKDYDGDTDTANLSFNIINNPPPPPPSGDGGGDGGGSGGCPLVFDMDRDGIELVSKAHSNILFDIDEDGVADRTAWVAADDAMLVLDKNLDGVINDHSEMFGNDEIGGYEVLGTYDGNGDGVIDANDEIWGKLQIWQDLNQDGISQSNELMTLDQAGFAAISLSVAGISAVIAGNNVTAQGEVTMTDGSTINGYDAWFQYDSGADNNFTSVDGQIKNLIEVAGAAVLHGQDGADDFLFHAIGQGNVSEINGFNASEGDSLDLSMILEGHDDVSAAINDFVYAREEGDSTVISVDVSGSGDASHAVDIVQLDNVTGLDITEMLNNGNIVL